MLTFLDYKFNDYNITVILEILEILKKQKYYISRNIPVKNTTLVCHDNFLNVQNTVKYIHRMEQRKAHNHITRIHTCI